MSTKTILLLTLAVAVILLVGPLRTILTGVLSKLLGPNISVFLLLICQWLYAIMRWTLRAHLVILRNLYTPKKLIYRDLQAEIDERK